MKRVAVIRKNMTLPFLVHNPRPRQVPQSERNKPRPPLRGSPNRIDTVFKEVRSNVPFAQFGNEICRPWIWSAIFAADSKNNPTKSDVTDTNTKYIYYCLSWLERSRYVVGIMLIKKAMRYKQKEQ